MRVSIMALAFTGLLFMASAAEAQTAGGSRRSKAISVSKGRRLMGGKGPFFLNDILGKFLAGKGKGGVVAPQPDPGSGPTPAPTPAPLPTPNPRRRPRPGPRPATTKAATVTWSKPAVTVSKAQHAATIATTGTKTFSFGKGAITVVKGAPSASATAEPPIKTFGKGPFLFGKGASAKGYTATTTETGKSASVLISLGRRF